MTSAEGFAGSGARAGFGARMTFRVSALAALAYVEGRYRIGAGGLSAGGSWLWRTTGVSIDTEGRFPGLEDRLSSEITLSAPGLELHFDNRGNPPTPTRDVNLVGKTGSATAFSAAVWIFATASSSPPGSIPAGAGPSVPWRRANGFRTVRRSTSSLRSTFAA